MRKTLSIYCFICFLFSLQQSYAECAYSEKIEQCSQAVSNNTHREISDFTCINKQNKQEIAYQIILDEQFQKIDTEIQTYLSELEKNKGKYFGKNKQASFTDAIDEITSYYAADGKYGSQYYQACLGLTQELLQCFPEGLQLTNTINYFGESQGSPCRNLANTKLSIYKQVSYDILMLNKLQVSRDEKKLYVQEQRSKYDGLLSKFMINIGFVERIWAKWPSKIRNLN